MTLEGYEPLVRRLSEEDGGGYLATYLDLPGCVSDGETPEEAIANLKDAAESWIETARALGWPIPAPQSHRTIA
ncbi:MAG: type II toxin-antitoxin system HicB family antitoxin [Pseudomonadota bacterium]|nr:type II toxin-antitoxin system HicB family antitoxin [Pseudomonadota bacterium]